jgi:hypothetical protein
LSDRKIASCKTQAYLKDSNRCQDNILPDSPACLLGIGFFPGIFALVARAAKCLAGIREINIFLRIYMG